MKDLLKKYKKRLIAGVAVVLLAIGAYFSGAPIDWGKVASDAASGEITDTAQKLEDAADLPAE